MRKLHINPGSCIQPGDPDPTPITGYLIRTDSNHRWLVPGSSIRIENPDETLPIILVTNYFQEYIAEQIQRNTILYPFTDGSDSTLTFWTEEFTDGSHTDIDQETITISKQEAG